MFYISNIDRIMFIVFQLYLLLSDNNRETDKNELKNRETDKKLPNNQAVKEEETNDFQETKLENPTKKRKTFQPPLKKS